MKQITAIIVAGGKGTRLGPVTNSIPKPMVRVAGKPTLEHILNLLKKNGVTNFIFALCYLPQAIIDHFGDGSAFGVSISYIFEDPEQPLGTAGAILAAKELVSDVFIVTHGDTLRDLDISQMIEKHTNSSGLATLNVYKHYGDNYKTIVEFNRTNKLTAFTELPKPIIINDGFAWSNGGVYIFEPKIFDYIREGVSVDFAKDVFPTIIADQQSVSVFKSDGYIIDMGTPKKLKQAEQDIRDGKINL